MSDEVVHRRWRGWDGRIYFCDSYDPQCGYWMTAEGDPPRRTCVSERAIGRTFHEVKTRIGLTPEQSSE